MEGKAKAGLIALLLLTIGLYFPVLGFSYVNFDDGSFVGAFPSQSGLWRFFSQFVAYDYIPLTWISFWVESWFFSPLEPVLSHSVNLTLHLANVFMVFVICRKLFEPRWLVIFGVSALFALHPLNVESVSWVTERKGLLSTLFFLLGIHLYILRLSEGDDWDRSSIRKMCLVYLCFLFALLAKPVALGFFFWMIGLDLYVRRRVSLKTQLIEKAPFVVTSVFFAALHVLARQSDQILATGKLVPSEAGQRIIESVLFYPLQFLQPKDLRVFYTMAEFERLGLILFLAVCLLLLVQAVFRKIDRKEVYLGLLIYLGTILPQTKFVPYGLGFVFADRYFYLAGLGLILLFVIAIERWRKPLGVLIFALFLISTLVITPRQLQTWRDSGSLWMNVLKSEPRLALAWTNLGLHQLDQDLSLAEASFQKALESDPRYAKAWINLAHIAEKRGNLQRAQEILEMGLVYSPQDVLLRQLVETLRKVNSGQPQN